ncbi:dTDP-4-dehydrorhamnose reductase [Gulosibacter molinativorax]|uniref:dTDP-4-dehydrorhamnose reductase n=1 Tax=Gulosibacter molinativorax TaxID=256821 RepID=A0ABT7C8L3_9MICO|nr:dTDP-4-dehydrorhamnose reductase [Gulosibacter molinativorax]MDJ1371492.1 dTDP-4-dehydrorhamnose reductase [Gulosibacter molinativorax]QUY62432.1 Putative dTDP-4-dehydrorhamnose 3,5-epimerase [Gulosibacter molinativorax]
MTEYRKPLATRATPIDGLVIVDLTVHPDNRGWFKENWQREKMVAAGIPDFGPVQNNMSFNAEAGITRGLHAEPWDKFVSVATGAVFGAWCDLRAGSPTYGQVATTTITPDVAVYVPRGVANGFQALEDGTAYSYLVNDHWSPDAEYAFVNLADPALGIDWPLPLTDLSDTHLSDKDRAHPPLAEVVPIAPRRILVTGAAGQLGTALRDAFPEAEFPGVEFVTHAELDITDPQLATARPWRQYTAIVNAAAYTAVDAAETTGRQASWAVNAAGVANLARVAAEFGLTLVHVSSDYVYDGASTDAYREDAPLAPLGVYGQTKAAGDLAAATAPRHYIVRTSWVIGDGANFVNTMASLADRGIAPQVVDDQIGRPTFTRDIAAGIRHLLETRPEYGVYHLTNTGEPASWAEVAREVYTGVGASADAVTGVSTAAYFEDKPGTSPRPLNSVLEVDKLTHTGFTAPSWRDRLTEYLKGLSR